MISVFSCEKKSTCWWETGDICRLSIIAPNNASAHKISIQFKQLVIGTSGKCGTIISKLLRLLVKQFYAITHLRGFGRTNTLEKLTWSLSSNLLLVPNSIVWILSTFLYLWNMSNCDLITYHLYIISGNIHKVLARKWRLRAVLTNVVPRYFLKKYCGITTYLLFE